MTLLDRFFIPTAKRIVFNKLFCNSKTVYEYSLHFDANPSSNSFQVCHFYKHAKLNLTITDSIGEFPPYLSVWRNR